MLRLPKFAGSILKGHCQHQDDGGPVDSLPSPPKKIPIFLPIENCHPEGLRFSLAVSPYDKYGFSTRAQSCPTPDTTPPWESHSLLRSWALCMPSHPKALIEIKSITEENSRFLWLWNFCPGGFYFLPYHSLATVAGEEIIK